MHLRESTPPPTGGPGSEERMRPAGMRRLPAKRLLLSHQRLPSRHHDSSTAEGKDDLPPVLGRRQREEWGAPRWIIHGFISCRGSSDAGSPAVLGARMQPGQGLARYESSSITASASTMRENRFMTRGGGRSPKCMHSRTHALNCCLPAPDTVLSQSRPLVAPVSAETMDSSSNPSSSTPPEPEYSIVFGGNGRNRHPYGTDQAQDA